MFGSAQVVWNGTSPGADTNTYVLFATCTPGTTQTDRVVQNANRDNACPARFFSNAGVRKFVLSLKYTATFTLNSYYSPDRGVTWIQEKTEVIPAPTAGFTLDREWLVEQYPDWKLEVLNGSSAQTTWSPQMALDEQRAVG